MKKIISFALLTCMLLSVVLPVSIYAAPALPSTVTNTSQLFNTESNTGLDAYPGTATIDGIWDENDDWSNALPLTLNSETKALIKDVGLAHSDNYANCYDGDFYLLWDETNLYILQVQRTCYGTIDYATAKTYNARPWWGSSHTPSWMTRYRILPGNQTFTTGTTQCKELWTTPTRTIDADGTLAELNTSYPTVLRYHNYKYTAASGTGTDQYGTPGGNITGVKSKFTKTGGTTHVSSYIMETSISWSYLGMTAPDTDATEDVVDAFGLKILAGIGDVQHLNGLEGGNAGWTGFDPISLKAEATTAEKATAPEAIDVAAAEAYWTDAENGQFIVNADATEYEISTAEQLLGLSLAMENNANDEEWTKGKTFKLTNDIDLNPGINWAAYKKQQSNFTGTITSVSEYYYTNITPTNEWLSLDCFYGTFDGQGHTISGVWALGAPNGTASGIGHWGVFGGYAYRGTAIKNVVLDNGYVSSSGSGFFGGVIGAFQHTLGTDDATTVDDGVLLENIYIGKNFTVDASQNTSKQAGGIMGSGDRVAHANSGDVGLLDLTFRNVVFAGHFKGANYYAGTFLGQTTYYFRSTYKVNLNLTDCLVTGTYEGTNADLGAIDETKRYSEFGAEGKRTNCYDFGNGAEQSIPEALAGKLIETSEGVMPVAVADMFTEYYWQATVENDGVYSVRIIGEIASIDYKSVDFRVEINRASDNKTAVWGYGVDGYVTAKSAYSSIIANNQTVTAADLNEGVLDGEDNNMYVMTLNDLDANETYTLSVTTFWTLEDGTVIEGQSVKNITPRPWVVNA